jgi:hypothetical protein
MKTDNFLLRLVVLMFMFFTLTFALYAQSENQLFMRRIVWRGDEYALRYAVEIDRLENGRYQTRLREFTQSFYIDVSLPLGEYRFRIIPYDILDRPAEASQWMRFEIRYTPRTAAGNLSDVTGESEQFEIISIEDYNLTGEREQITDTMEEDIQPAETITERGSPRFNTIGVSVGTSFIDPLVIATVHGTFSPIQNFFIEAGCDFGFFSIYEDVENFYSLYGFINIGYFMPFRGKGGFFVSAGGGYMNVNYVFAYGEAGMNVFGANFTAGINLWDMFNVSYTIRTDFSSASNKLAVGYVFRF